MTMRIPDVEAAEAAVNKTSSKLQKMIGRGPCHQEWEFPTKDEDGSIAMYQMRLLTRKEELTMQDRATVYCKSKYKDWLQKPTEERQLIFAEQYQAFVLAFAVRSEQDANIRIFDTHEEVLNLLPDEIAMLGDQYQQTANLLSCSVYHLSQAEMAEKAREIEEEGLQDLNGFLLRNSRSILQFVSFLAIRLHHWKKGTYSPSDASSEDMSDTEETSNLEVQTEPTQ